MPMPAAAHSEDVHMHEVTCKPDPDLYIQSNSRVTRWEEPQKRVQR